MEPNQHKSFCTVKETISKIKGNLRNGRKYLHWQGVNIQNILTAHKTQYIKKKCKWEEELNTHFSREDIQVTSGHMERCSTLLIIREWKSLSWLTLCDLMDYIVCGIFQARILEWVAIHFSKGSSLPRDRTQISHIAGRLFISWAMREAQEYLSG